MDEQLNH